MSVSDNSKIELFWLSTDDISFTALKCHLWTAEMAFSL